MSSQRLRKDRGTEHPRSAHAPQIKRASGVHPKEEPSRERLLAAEAPTVPPPRPPISVTQIKVGAPIDELLYRFSMGDFKGALAVAEALLDEERIPIVMVPPDLLVHMRLDHREAFLVSFIDGQSSLDAVLQASGMPMLEGLRAICELIEKKIIGLR
jgi:hypothetical protein